MEREPTTRKLYTRLLVSAPSDGAILCEMNARSERASSIKRRPWGMTRARKDMVLWACLLSAVAACGDSEGAVTDSSTSTGMASTWTGNAVTATVEDTGTTEWDGEGCPPKVWEGWFTYQNDEGPHQLSELEGVTRITGPLSIGRNFEPFELSSLHCLEHAESHVRITENPGLTSLEGLESLTLVEGTDFSVFSNPNLTSLKGLEGLTRIERALSITKNHDLTNLDALNPEKGGSLTRVGEYITIWDNNDLDQCAAQELADVLSALHLPINVTVEDNLECAGTCVDGSCQ